MNLQLVLRIAGVSLIFLSLFHAVLWRSLGWSREIAMLSPLSRRVFVVHTFFIAFVLLALGLLSALHPKLLLVRSELARLLLLGIVVFWVARFLLQPLVFDGAMRSGWTRGLPLRIGVCVVWLSYVAVYGAALGRQWGWL